MHSKPIDIHPMYEITKTGTVFSHFANKIKERKASISYKGYLVIRAKSIKGSWKNYSVHRLVAFAYMPGFNFKLQIDHIDGNKLNNDITNLRNVTNSVNQLNAVRLGKLPANQKTVGKFDLLGNLLEVYPNGTEAAKSVDKQNSSNILRCCRRVRPTAFKYIWKFM